MRKISFSNEQTAQVFAEHDYAGFSKLMYDTAMGKVANVTSAEANDKIREVFRQVLGLSEDADRRELRKAIRRHKIDIYEVIEETLDNLIVGGWGENPFFREFVDFRSYAAGDTNVFVTPDETYLTVSEVSGGHHDIIRQRLGSRTSYSIKTSWYAAKIYTEFELFIAGRVDWARFIQKIYEAFDRKINELLYTAFGNAGSVLPNSAQWNKTGTLVKATMLTLIEDVQAANPNKEIVIIGSKAALSMLDALANVNWISDEMKETRNTLGRLAIWEGVRLVEIPQVFALNDTTTKLVDNTKLLVMPVDPDNKPVKFYDEGEAYIKEVSDGDTNMDMTLEYEYQRKMGCGVAFSRYFGVYDV